MVHGTVIVDPYGNGLYDSKGNVRNNGFAKNAKQTDPAGLIEYNFAKSPTLQVPGDWNTQRDSLMYYEGPLWYEKDFEYHKIAASVYSCTSERQIIARIFGLMANRSANTKAASPHSIVKSRRPSKTDITSPSSRWTIPD